MEMDLKEKSQGKNQNRRRPMHLATSAVIGIDDIAIEIMDKLTSQHKCDRQIISISGMGGIGKTTLARRVYENKCIKNYFDVCAWGTISKDYSIQESLIEILRCLDSTKSRESLRKKNEYHLGEQLYQFLIGRRYLVILDDVWDIEAFDRLRSFFPASRGSGIVITTRELTVASISSHNFRMDLLDEPKSWDLFCKNVFGKDSCPRELEDVGRRIANNCRGLPLSIVVIGGHLAKSPRTQEYWIYIADNLNSVVNSDNNEHSLKVLSLSYTNLPVHLKSCFLCLGNFPEDEEILVSEIVRLWIAEGILKPINGKSLEEATEDYLNDLKARNLISAFRSSIRGKTISYKIHDLLRDLCLKKGTKNFFRIVQKQWLRINEANNELQISFSSFCEPTRIRIRTLTFCGESPFECYRLLQKLPMGGGSLTISENHTIEYLDLVNLQRLEVTMNTTRKIQFFVPQSIFSLWNLQSLVIEAHGETKAPPEIWEMSQLRHISVGNLYLPNPPSESCAILKKLQFVITISNFSFSEDLVKRVPNVKILAVRYNEKFKGAYALNNIARLGKLESFYCSFPRKVTKEEVIQKYMLSNVSFPLSLTKLYFSNLRWDDVTIKIGSLPLLEVLKLEYCSGPEWMLVEGQFVSLKYLELESCHYLQCLKADKNHFPCLHYLVLKSMPCLKEISSDIGDIPTLRSIALIECPDSAVVCAKEIAEAQYEMGNNEELQIFVVLDYPSGTPSESWMSTANFHVEA